MIFFVAFHRCGGDATNFGVSLLRKLTLAFQVRRKSLESITSHTKIRTVMCDVCVHVEFPVQHFEFPNEIAHLE